MLRYCAFTAAVLGLLILVACSDYSLKVNDNTVYNPYKLFTEFRLADDALQRCADDTIREQRLRRAEHVTELRCTAMDIQSLEGLAVFTHLKVLGLEGNRVSTLSPLMALENLEQLNLADNAIRDAQALLSLKQLHYLDLRSNPEVDCKTIRALKIEGELILPVHCQ